MLCGSTDECFEQISAYYNGKRTGHFLLINTDNYDDYQGILHRLEADNGKKCIYTSQYVLPNGLPDIDIVISEGKRAEEGVLVGISQALMLRSASVLEAKIDELLEQPIGGYGVVLLDHCEQILRDFINRDLRIKKRVVLVDGESSPLPRIKIAKNEEFCIENTPIPDFSHLLAYLERLTDVQLKQSPALTVVSPVSSKLFQQAVYSVTEVESIYEVLTSKYSDIAGATELSYGTDSQWLWLATAMKPFNTFSALICELFGSTSNLSIHLQNVMANADKNQKWLLWLAMKVFDEPHNKYLSNVLINSETFDDFEEHVYYDFIKVNPENDDFDRLYRERKRLIQQLPENLRYPSQYCEKLGRRQKMQFIILQMKQTMKKMNLFVVLVCMNIQKRR